MNRIRVVLDDYVERFLCPFCGFEYTHHYAVYVANRDTEDGPGEITVVHPNRYETVKFSDGRPLPPDEVHGNSVHSAPLEAGRVTKDVVGRRDCVFIEMECEDCERKWLLAITQHKGLTLLDYAEIDVLRALNLTPGVTRLPVGVVRLPAADAGGCKERNEENG